MFKVHMFDWEQKESTRCPSWPCAEETLRTIQRGGVQTGLNFTDTVDVNFWQHIGGCLDWRICSWVMSLRSKETQNSRLLHTENRGKKNNILVHTGALIKTKWSAMKTNVLHIAPSGSYCTCINYAICLYQSSPYILGCAGILIFFFFFLCTLPCTSFLLTQVSWWFNNIYKLNLPCFGCLIVNCSWRILSISGVPVCGDLNI